MLNRQTEPESFYTETQNYFVGSNFILNGINIHYIKTEVTTSLHV